MTTNHIDPIEALAFAELIISCQSAGCLNLFERTIVEPATDPVDQWAKNMAELAREAGWSI